MSKIGYGYGSEWHLLRYLGRHRERLNESVLNTIDAESINWLDFKFSLNGKWTDREFTGVDFVKDQQLSADWREFWPQRGNAQNWDAIAKIECVTGTEWLLVEAKSHTKEVITKCTAKLKGGRRKIVETLNEVKRNLEVPDQADWLEPYYQFCNRIAALYFLHNHGVRARLMFIYFTGDHMKQKTCYCPVSNEGWQDVLQAQDRHVRLPEVHELNDRIHKLFLPVRG
ncbi:MAG: hypothetical protein P9M08_02035 [Candidatus Erginobacter occultus]|nr:hypothetical protein [Candidatus Erginobacter occultus]